MKKLHVVTLVALSVALVSCGKNHFADDPDAGQSSDSSLADSSAVDAAADSSGFDAQSDGSARDSAVKAGCSPMQVTTLVCGACDDSGPSFFYWDGTRCRTDDVTQGCRCDGPDCNRVYGSRLECERAHADCNPRLCDATGGRWGVGCGMSHCGKNSHPDIDCDSEHPLCVCPIGSSWRDEVGCAPDSSCGSGDACLATGGRLAAGSPGGCACPHRASGQTFDPELGCSTFESQCDCPGPGFDCNLEACARAQACAATGGTPIEGCDDRVCGHPGPRPCAELHGVCDCGPWKVFDETYGCVESDQCLVRKSGQGGCESDASGGANHVVCEPGTICQDDNCEGLVCEAGQPTAACSTLHIDRSAREVSECAILKLETCCQPIWTGVRSSEVARAMAHHARCFECVLDVECPEDPPTWAWTDEGVLAPPGDVSIQVVEGECRTFGAVDTIGG